MPELSEVQGMNLHRMAKQTFCKISHEIEHLGKLEQTFEVSLNE